MCVSRRFADCPSRDCVPVQKPLIPVTVQDQIRLWELEKNRVKSDEGTALISIDMMRTPLSCWPVDSRHVRFDGLN